MPSTKEAIARMLQEMMLIPDRIVSTMAEVFVGVCWPVA